jgi:hypothetical protein
MSEYIHALSFPSSSFNLNYFHDLDMIVFVQELRVARSNKVAPREMFREANAKYAFQFGCGRNGIIRSALFAIASIRTLSEKSTGYSA